ncbi:MAG: adenylate/guanylate cyclase domain-containing protein [Flavobacteriales bacterium]
MFHAKRSQDIALQVKIQRGISLNLTRLGRYKEAYEHDQERFALNDSLLNMEKVRSLTEMQEKFESVQKAKEILALKAEGLESDLVKSRLQRTRNIYLFSGLGIMGLAVGLYSRLRYIHRSRAAIQREKDVSEGLLHNILPEEVAAEIKAKGYADVNEFETATVLFTDFKGFTAMSEKMSAAELVAEIDVCFKAFDHIMERYGIEKIKTIGDAYMAAGGLPDRKKGSPLEVVMAALDMQDFMRTYSAQRIAANKLYFQMRLGIHTGPVIAGIVGVKKYAYDIWGDTVNVASRMESSGEVGAVNISESTYELVRHAPGLHIVPRGMVEAKGKGRMAMYFVSRSEGTLAT